MRSLAALLFGLTAVALAAQPELRGWSEGTPAAGAARVLAGPDAESLPELTFPKNFAKRFGKRTLLFYFSPGCPHCQAVAEEFGNLARDLPSDVVVLGVATSSSDKVAVDAFKTTYGIDFDIVIDTDRTIGAAMGARSTPSVLMVTPAKAEKHRILDVWYPYQSGFDMYVKMRAATDPFSVLSGYNGNAACMGCHTQEGEAWALSHHSIAWRTLEKAEKQTDPECVSCHVVGFGEATGWTGPETPSLRAVGCESCHGPSGPHDGKRTDPNTTCAGCHDAKHSIQFSLAKGLPLIDHYKANGLDDDAFRKQRMALIDGEAPRTLLDFAPDPTVGAEACKSCHEEAYAQWKGAGHSHAMEVLRKEGKDQDASCVSCHATASKGGPRPTELSAFRVDESVGCEACHGPGGKHVAAKGGTDNIERLGEDCPVCVIEAVCTSCHTAEWDKDWDLETHLPRVGHGTPP